MSRINWQSLRSMTIATLMLLSLSNGYHSSSDCNEAVCARIVTRCLLTEQCKCDFTIGNYTCHKDCFSCLAELCYDCCSCFGMCPKITSNPQSKVSNIEELDEPIPELFKLYSSVDGDDQVPPKYTSLSFEQRKTLMGQVLTRNCTVAYTANCMSNDECTVTCKNMGSSFTRWFHDGCCECGGDTCFDYGLAEARCSNCPPTFHEHADINDFYYGEDDDDAFFDENHDNHNSWTTNFTHSEIDWKDPGNRDWNS